MKTAPPPWIARLPAGLFAMPLGLLGLAGAWRRASQFGSPDAVAVAQALAGLALCLGLLLGALYLLKWLRHPQAVRAELAHPVAGPLMAAMPLATLLAVAFYGQPDRFGWLALAVGAMALQARITLPVVSGLVTGNPTAWAMTPALYMPPVGGGFIGALAFQALGFPSLAALLYGMGLASWFLLEARVLNRLFEGPLPEPARPTIGIELAPPALATLTAATLWPSLPGAVLLVGLGLAAGPLVTVLARYRWWSKVPFGAGFWSFSFPVAALASGVIEATLRSHTPFWIAGTALAMACGVFLFLTVRTLALLLRGRLIPPAPSGPAGPPAA